MKMIQVQDVRPGDLIHRWSWLKSVYYTDPTPGAWDEETEEVTGISKAQELEPALVIYANVRNKNSYSFAVIDILEGDKRTSRRLNVKNIVCITQRIET